MYLAKLFQYNKILFIITACCICLQLFINAKKGMTATPFLHLGMYSGKFNLPDTIQALEFIVNGKKINLCDFSSKNVDNIIDPINFFNSLEQSSVIYEKNISRILPKIYIPYDKFSFDPVISQQGFANWYKKRLRNILNSDISDIQISQNTYSVSGSSLKKIQSKIIYATN